MNILKDSALIRFEIENLLKEYNSLTSDTYQDVFTAAKQNDEKHLECFYSSITSSECNNFLVSYQVYYFLLVLKTELLKELINISKTNNEYGHSFIANKLIALFIRLLPLIEFPILSEGKFESITPEKFDNDDLVFGWDKYQLSLTHDYLRFITDKMVLDLLKDLKLLIFTNLINYSKENINNVKENIYNDIRWFIFKHIKPLTIIIYVEDQEQVHKYIVNRYKERMNTNFNNYNTYSEAKKDLTNFNKLNMPVELFIIENCFNRTNSKDKEDKIKYNLIAYYLINKKSFTIPLTKEDLKILEDRKKPKPTKSSTSSSSSSNEESEEPKTSFEIFLEENDITESDFNKYNKEAKTILDKIKDLPTICYYYILEDDEYYKQKILNNIF